jgi:hypothetical protein
MPSEGSFVFFHWMKGLRRKFCAWRPSTVSWWALPQQDQVAEGAPLVVGHVRFLGGRPGTGTTDVGDIFRYPDHRASFPSWVIRCWMRTTDRWSVDAAMIASAGPAQLGVEWKHEAVQLATSMRDPTGRWVWHVRASDLHQPLLPADAEVARGPRASPPAATIAQLLRATCATGPNTARCWRPVVIALLTRRRRGPGPLSAGEGGS